VAASVVKRSRVLDEVDAEAEVPYEETRLARGAARARPRVALLLLLGAGGLALEALAQRDALWLAPAAFVLASAWGARRGALAGVIGAALVALLAVFLPLGLAALGVDDPAGWVAIVACVAWGIALAPGVLTLVRDAELQHAYGRWARR
jgi:hypothetical protein